jgi:hypothetical protein
MTSRFPPGVNAYARGHALRYSPETDWVYVDDGTPYEDKRPCASCGLYATAPHEPDPCLGYLPGVDYACCGHGIPGMDYIAASGVRYDSVAEWAATHPEHAHAH